MGKGFPYLLRCPELIPLYSPQATYKSSTRQ